MERPYLKLWERYLNEQSAWNQSAPAPAPAAAPAPATPATPQPATPAPAEPTTASTGSATPAATAPVASKPVNWKDLAKQGYEQTMGSRPFDRSTVLQDSNVSAMGSNISAADMALQQQLRAKKIFDWSRQGQIVHRTTSDGKIESRYLANSPK